MQVSVYNTHLSSIGVIRKLKQDGWVLRNTRGSHHHFTHPKKAGRVTVKHPTKDILKQPVVRVTRAALRAPGPIA
ncbi:MAG: type II toxin-antitoxin system HicA family toxin [Bryobacterales bacterium]|nr:type II toxin-antitoxin system HicA family toxin [Bryobacterales bacterium]MDE0295013.1 type II toxin-antitoxin system HicA family toxin [Bryobacterales bacterium]